MIPRFGRRGDLTRDDSRGSILVVVLWLLVFFSAVTAILGARVRTQIGAVKRFQEDIRASTKAWSGVSTVLNYLDKWNALAPGATSPTPLEPGFFLDNPLYFKTPYFSIGTAGPDGNIRYGLEDQEQKINLNKVSRETLVQIYTVSPEIGQGNAQALADATIAWRDRKNPFLEFGHHLEGEEGSGFGSVEELFFVPGMPKEFVERVKNSLTVYGSGKVNLNSAPKETLVLLGLNEGLAARIVEYRLSAAKDQSGGMKAFKDLAELTLKVGVGPEENAQLSNVSSVWGFDSEAFRFRVFEDKGDGILPRKGVECLVDHKGRILFFRDL
ncbi:MAG: general secretion pathway protein GspK [Candidatus Omnitrophica bacterium]|nr:general secretion pathway protein GspK [Candidatus Omnitrophota bacterium]